MSTNFPSDKNIVRNVRLLDATGLVLGRLASMAAQALTGKNNPLYAPFLDFGDRVIIVNAAKISISGKKRNKKIYHRYTGYPGGLRKQSLSTRLNRDPEGVVRDAVLGMLPKTRLGRRMGKKLRVYRSELPYPVQQLQLSKEKKPHDLLAFKNRLINDMREWIGSLSPEKRVEAILYVGHEKLHVKDLLENIVMNTSLGQRFVKAMHTLENSNIEAHKPLPLAAPQPGLHQNQSVRAS